MALNETNPRPGDTEPELLRKILTILGGLQSPGDTTEKITAKIVLALQSAISVGGSAATKTYADTGDAATLAAAKTYTDTSVRTSLITLNAFVGNGGLLVTSGVSETSAGIGALRQVTSGNSNCAFGQNALQQDTTGASNCAFGVSASKFQVSGGSNFSAGASALQSDTTGSKNIGIGETTLFDLNIVANDGSGANTAVGYNTGRGIITGVNNTILGANVTGLSAALSNNIILATGAGTIRLQCDSTGLFTFTGSINYTMLIAAKTSAYPIVAADGNTVLTNTGAGGSVTFTLPATSVGLHYFFSVEVAQSFVIKAVGADVIQIAGAVSSAAGTATNATVGSTLHLICSKAGKWVSFAREGTWTLA